MFTAGAENYLRQAREIQDEELQKFCVRIAAFLQQQDLGSETVDNLQRLYLIASATKYDKKLERKFLEHLQCVLCLPKASLQVQVLCTAILREVSPSELVTLSFDQIHDTKLLSLVSSILLAQGCNNNALTIGNRIAKMMESRLPEGQSLRHLLPVLSKLTNVFPASLSDDQTNLINKKLVDWLRYASIHQGIGQLSGGFFSSPRTKLPGPITEVDGAIATDFFTVLSIGHRYTEDQWLNMQAFSMLRKWLLCYGTDSTSTANSDDKSEVDGSVMSMVSATSTSSRLLPPKERLREKAFEYCQRLIDQSNRKAVKKSDADLQKACLIEAVSIMDIVCRQDCSYVYRALSFLKTVHVRICQDLTLAPALLPIAQFFLNHSEMAAVDAEAVYRHLFTRIPAELFYQPLLAFEFIHFCRNNARFFVQNIGLFRRSFPNLLKFLAWNSPGLVSDFVEFLPSLIGPDTVIEIFHSLLDLPCLAAALELQHRSRSAPASEKVLMESAVHPASSMEAFRHPHYGSLFQYLLRREARPGDTVDSKFHLLRQILGDMAGCPRVMQCIETVPVLLQLFFKVVAEFADGVLINQLVLVLLDRSSQLYSVPKFQTDVHRVMSSQLLSLCKLHPSVIVEQSKELLEFSGTVTNIQNKETFFTYVVWAIGEYLSVSYDKRCTVDQINKFFEVLEALLFEITQLRSSAGVPKCSPRLITVLMTTLTKLASRSQDLIPRVLLYLSKMRSCVQSSAMISMYGEEDSEEVLIRAAELMNLLKMPNVAQFVLSPSAEVNNVRYHRDANVSLPLAMRTVTQLLQKDSGFGPG
ncbi:AP-5 complex subunit zeta-1 [Microcaecilia unicolor]|uniref:AP-5 complex subunit zeta-1-like n=1 Tax=Microcaecilia unicolor TaxID=1415580 RepID=A0A6P7YHV6_9AMPH|nr:AP-5 complex subunit zeta-1-like [Microcaecilia unicolor]